MTAETPSTSPRLHKSVMLAATATALSLLGDQALYAILPAHYERLGLRKFQVGILLSVNRWIRLITNHFAEWLVHHFNPTRLLLAALLLGAALTLLYGVTPVFAVLLGARILWGLSWSVIRQVGVMTSVDATVAGRTAQTIGSYEGLSRLGSMAGMVAGALLFDTFLRYATGKTDHTPFLWTFVLLSIVSLAALCPGFLARRGLVDHHSTFRRLRRSAPPTGGWQLLVCGFLIGCVGPGVIMATLGYVLKERVGGGVAIAGVVVGVTTLNGCILATRYVMNAALAPSLGALQDRIGHRLGAVLFSIGGLLALLVAALAATSILSSLVLLVAMVVLFYLCATGLHVVLMAEAGHRGSRLFARFASAADFGSAAGPLVGWTALTLLSAPAIAPAIGAVLYGLAVPLALRRLLTDGRHGRDDSQENSANV